jgi:hypothetical protein
VFDICFGYSHFWQALINFFERLFFLLFFLFFFFFFFFFFFSVSRATGNSFHMEPEGEGPGRSISPCGTFGDFYFFRGNTIVLPFCWVHGVAE